MNPHRRLVGFLVVGALAFAPGCGGDDAADNLTDKIADEVDGDVEVDREDGSVKLTDDEGNVTEIGGATLPDGWPEAMDPPDQVTLVTSSTQQVDGTTTLYASGEADGTVAQFFQGLKQQVTDAGLEIESDSLSDAGGTRFGSIIATGDEYDVTVSVTDSDEEGVVAISVAVTLDDAES